MPLNDVQFLDDAWVQSGPIIIITADCASKAIEAGELTEMVITGLRSLLLTGNSRVILETDE